MAGRPNRNQGNQEGLQVNPPAPEEEEDENIFVEFINEAEYASAVVPPRVENATFKIDSSIYHLLKLEGYFRNSAEDCPLRHLKNFLHVCAQQSQGAVSADALRLRVFKYSLAGPAREWYEKLPSNSIHTWNELANTFLKKWFPPSKKAELRDKIFEFKQLPREQLYSAWEHFKYYLAQSPTHGFSDAILTEKFYKGLDTMNQIAVNSAAGGCFMDKSFIVITRLLDKLTTHNQAWHSSDSEFLSYSSPSAAAVAKENHKRDHAFAQLQTTVDLLSKRLTNQETKSVNVVEEMPPRTPGMYQVSEEVYLEGQPQREDANYIDHSQGGYQKPWRPQQQSNKYGQNDYGGSDRRDYNNNNYGNRNFNAYVPPKGRTSNSQNWRESPSNDQGTSRMESMLEKILDNQLKSDKKMENLTEVVGSGKVLDAVNQKVVEPIIVDPIIDEVVEEEVEQEKEAPIEVPIVVEKENEVHPSVEMGDEEPNVKKATGESFPKSKVTGAIKPLTQTYKPPPPFPQRLMKRTEDAKCQRFYDQLKGLPMNIPFLDAFQEMSGFAKYLKDLLIKKRPIKHDTIGVTHRVSSIISSSNIEKKGDPGAFTIPCTSGHHNFARALCDNGASINLMPLAIYKQAGLGTPKPTSMRLQMADRTIKRPVGIVDDILVRVGEFLLPADFVILDCAVEKEVPIILGRPFLATGRALMDSEKHEIKFRVNNEEVTF
ncbi:uncharacterized protein LOC132066051 [Lycium ferocissimum]|uniref:uncharacterized protein LOC132066051 n=1 Tax=Lycium ferocissimum TaxID=112874 RepID=UPI002815AC75|nr:uncharacterized protein LOC132066051 [Lycium ferocissimum]